jgi:hypothetical protein
MSEESKFNSNIAMAFAAVAIAAVAWFAVSSGNNSDTQIATTADPPSEVVPAVVGIENDEVVEEVIVTADPNNLPSDEELTSDELAEKAQEAAIRNQVKEAMKKSEDAE